MDWFVRYWLRYFSLGFDLHIWLQAPETGKRALDQTKKAFTRSRVVEARKLFLNIPPLILSLYTSQENHARLGPLLYEMISWCFLFFHFLLLVCECLQQKNVLDRLRLIRALFPGIIISPPSSFKGISSSGLGNSTTSGCCEKTKQTFYGLFTCKEFTHLTPFKIKGCPRMKINESSCYYERESYFAYSRQPLKIWVFFPRLSATTINDSSSP